MQERNLFSKVVLGILDRIDPCREVIITNPKNERVIRIPERELKSDFLLKYQLKQLEEPQIKP